MKYIIKLHLKGQDDAISCEYSGIVYDNYDEAIEEFSKAVIDTVLDHLVDLVYIQEVDYER